MIMKLKIVLFPKLWHIICHQRSFSGPLNCHEYVTFDCFAYLNLIMRKIPCTDQTAHRRSIHTMELCSNKVQCRIFWTLSSPSFRSGLFRLWIWSEPLLQTGVSIKNQNRMANIIDPDETAHDEPSHQDLHRLRKLRSGMQGWNA